MLLGLLACLGTPYVPPPPVVVTAPEPGDAAGRLAWMVAGDPLVRHPRLPTWVGGAAPEEAGLVEVVALSRDDRSSPITWWDLERHHRGTAAVALARGGRLAAVEAFAGAPDAAPWIGPLGPAGGPMPENPRRPLGFLGDPVFEAQLVLVERQVLLGWLDGPQIDVGPAARAMGGVAFDRLGASPTGALLLARAAAPRDAAAGAAGLADLVLATSLAVDAAAADADREQEAVRVRAEKLRMEQGLPADRPVVPALLSRGMAALLRDAGEARSAGLALVALGAARWVEACPDRPCLGFDRIDTLAAAARWSPESDALGRAWLVVAHKDTADQVRAAWDTPFLTRGLDRLFEVLTGGGRPVDGRLTRYGGPDPAMMLLVQRTLGGPDLTDRDPLLRTLEAATGAAADRALEVAPEALRAGLMGVRRRVGR